MPIWLCYGQMFFPMFLTFEMVSDREVFCHLFYLLHTSIVDVKVLIRFLFTARVFTSLTFFFQWRRVD